MSSYPGYDRGRTLIILMGVARLAQVLKALLEEADDVEGPSSKRDGHVYPQNIPIAIIERGSMPDQRVITSTLRGIAAALESVGEQRPWYDRSRLGPYWRFGGKVTYGFWMKGQRETVTGLRSGWVMNSGGLWRGLMSDGTACKEDYAEE